MSKPRVLIVDDNVANLQLAKFLLEQAGFETAKALDVLEARALLRSYTPDLVLMDVQLPTVDGLTATRQLKADPALAHIPVVAFTSYAMKGDEERMLAAGCSGYVSKPIEVSSFAATIRGYLTGKRG